MYTRCCALTALLLIGLVARLSAQSGGEWTRPPQAVSSAIDAAIESYSRGLPQDFAIAVIDLESGTRWGIRDTVTIGAASLAKILYAYELYRRAGAGEVRLDSVMTVRRRFMNPLYATETVVTWGGDGDRTLHDSIGRPVALRYLAIRMITHSSDIGAAHVLDVVTRDGTQLLLRRLGIPEFNTRVTFGQGPDGQPALRNVTTPRSIALLLENLARCELLTPEMCAELIDTMADQNYRDRVPAGVPHGVRVANKTAWPIDGYHDAAIIYPPGRAPYILVVSSYDTPHVDESKPATIAISRIVWEALRGTHGRR